MADKKRLETAEPEPALDAEDIKRRLDMMDRRLDNIDSIVSAVIERVMAQALTVTIVCPHCGRSLEIALIGNKKPGK